MGAPRRHRGVAGLVRVEEPGRRRAAAQRGGRFGSRLEYGPWRSGRGDGDRQPMNPPSPPAPPLNHQMSDPPEVSIEIMSNPLYLSGARELVSAVARRLG